MVSDKEGTALSHDEYDVERGETGILEKFNGFFVVELCTPCHLNN